MIYKIVNVLIDFIYSFGFYELSSSFESAGEGQKRKCTIFSGINNVVTLFYIFVIVDISRTTQALKNY